MKSRNVAVAACLLSLSALAVGAESTAIPPAEDPAAVQAELARQSGLPESELAELLKDCDANQTSLTFCARRDQVATEMWLGRVVADKIKQRPECRTTIEQKLAEWRKVRDKGCETMADKEYGHASMKPMARAMCLQVETERMTARIEQMKGCKL